MSETTWIISPKGLAWGLLIVATLALCVIAWYLRRLSFRVSSNAAPVSSPRLNTTRPVMPIYVIIIFLLIFGWLIFLSVYNLEYDPDKSLGVIVSVLCLLVTALIGWNIYNLIDLKQIRRESVRLNNRLQGLRDVVRVRANEAIAVSLIQTADAMNRIETHDDTDIVLLAFNTLSVLLPLEIQVESRADDARGRAISLIHDIIDSERTMPVSAEDHNWYLRIALQLNDERILNWVRNFPIIRDTENTQEVNPNNTQQ